MEPNVTSVSNSEIVQAIEQLSLPELESLVDEVAALRARRVAPILSEEESSLFAIINQALPESERVRLLELQDKRVGERLTHDEHQELLALQYRLEALHAERLKALAMLAKIRGLTLTALMEQLGIQFPDFQ
ncbi:MAG TPA: STAS/SEC14 domain-containing protein [Blastocatellia bacterium]|nr:STAS/SEC14 domain-containing protein [Blastocatellia bacterium]